jgi:beta-glucosidase
VKGEPLRASDAFPPGFAWGAATSAYQIEGSPRADGKGESIWDRFARSPGRIRDGATGDVACDHYRRWSTDVALMVELGLRAYRFSVAWTRVLPAGTGRVNEAGVDFYERLVDGLLAAGIEPWVTLYHWDLPQALEDRGGWPARETAAAFAGYAEVLSGRLGDRVQRWMTVNEPWEIGFLGYGSGVHAPGRAELRDALAAIHTVLLAHGDAVQAIRASSPRARVGIALDLVACYPDRGAQDAAAAARMDGHLNRWFLDPLFGRGYPQDMVALYGPAAPAIQPHDMEIIATPIDFVGLNYYYSQWVRTGKGAGKPATQIERLLRAHVVPPHTDEVTALGWAVHPEGLEESLLRLGAMAPSLEIAVTESGAAFEDRRTADGRIDDPERTDYHAAYLDAVRRAIAKGAPVGGYFAWSLLDNFEWAEGYGAGARFGLVGVDFATQARTIKASGAWYRDLIAREGERAG